MTVSRERLEAVRFVRFFRPSGRDRLQGVEPRLLLLGLGRTPQRDHIRPIDLTGRIAAWLFRNGVKPGDRVAIAMRNYPEWMLIYWACVSVGVAVVGMNAWWVADEVEYALSDSQPKVTFCDAERLERTKRLAAVSTAEPPQRWFLDQLEALGG